MISLGLLVPVVRSGQEPHSFRRAKLLYRLASDQEALGDEAEVYDVDELVELMHRMQEGVDVRTRIEILNPYRQCFKGCDAVEFMCVQGLALDEEHALELGMARERIFHCCSSTSVGTVVQLEMEAFAHRPFTPIPTH